MKTAICTVLCLLNLFARATAAESNTDVRQLTPADLQEVTSFFALLDSGKSMLSDLRDETNSPLRNKIISYYQTSTNQLSLEHQFVVATCMLAEVKEFSAAARITEAYISKNPTNGRGWVLVGSAALTVSNTPRCIEAYEKAIELGQTNVVAMLCAVAFTTGQNDVIKKHLPQLLAVLEDKKSERNDRQDALNVIVVYAMRINDEELFLKAVRGLDMRLVRDKKDLLTNLDKACRYFESQRTEEFCVRIKNALKTNLGP